jgi:ligand-binding sensor domain-containing protein
MKLVIFIFLWSVLSFCSGKQEQSKVERRPKDGSSAAATVGSALKKSDGLIYFSGDNGLSWQNKSDGLPPASSLGIGGIAVSESDLAIATKEGGVYLFDFQKDEWTSIPTDTQIIRNNPGALALFRGQIFIGTQSGGVFFSENHGISWTNQRKGLASLTIRKLVAVGQKLYAGTNAGLYSYNESEKKWDPEFGSTTLQVNGITEFEGNIFIGTNQGVFANTADGGKE